MERYGYILARKTAERFDRDLPLPSLELNTIELLDQEFQGNVLYEASASDASIENNQIRHSSFAIFRDGMASVSFHRKYIAEPGECGWSYSGGFLGWPEIRNLYYDQVIDPVVIVQSSTIGKGLLLNLTPRTGVPAFFREWKALKTHGSIPDVPIVDESDLVPVAKNKPAIVRSAPPQAHTEKLSRRRNPIWMGLQIAAGVAVVIGWLVAQGIKLAFYAIGLLFIVGLAIGVARKFGGNPSCQVVSVVDHGHVYTDQNGDPDFGIQVEAVVANNGDDGTIQTDAILTSSDGNWKRTQSIRFARDQKLDLYYDFPEPTITTQNIRSSVSCSP